MKGKATQRSLLSQNVTSELHELFQEFVVVFFWSIQMVNLLHLQPELLNFPNKEGPWWSCCRKYLNNICFLTSNITKLHFPLISVMHLVKDT